MMEQKGWGTSGSAWMDPRGCVGSKAPWLSSPKADEAVEQRLLMTKANTNASRLKSLP